MDAFKVAKAMTPFTIDSECRARQQKDLLAYVRELTTRIPELNFLRNYRQYDFDVALADFLSRRRRTVTGARTRRSRLARTSRPSLRSR